MSLPITTPTNRSRSPTIWDTELRHNQRKDSHNKTETSPLVELHPPGPPPLAGPEIDDLEPTNPTTHNRPYPGIDDGFFNTNDTPDFETVPIDEPKDTEGDEDVPDFDKPRAGFPVPRPFPYAPGFGPNGYRPTTNTDFPDIDSMPDVNVYQHKKTLAQGMMDLALFSANANQLRYVIESSSSHPYYYPSIVMIALSLFLQVAIGVGLIWNSRYNVKDEKEICIANKINNYTVIGIFIVTSINVFISAFGVASSPPIIIAGPGANAAIQDIASRMNIDDIFGNFTTPAT